MAEVRRIAHVALLVRGIEEAALFWEEALGIKLSRTENVAGEDSRVGFLSLGDDEIELVEPAKPDSSLSRYLQKRGPGLHHLCLEVNGIDEMLLRLKRRGVRLINETPLWGTDGRRYAFIHPEAAHGVLVELCEPGDPSFRIEDVG